MGNGADRVVRRLPACIGCVVQLGGVHLPNGLVLSATALRTAPTQQLAARRLLALLHEIVDQLLPASESTERTQLRLVSEPCRRAGRPTESVCFTRCGANCTYVRRCAVRLRAVDYSNEGTHESARAGDACGGCVVVVVRVCDRLRWGVSSQRDVWRM